MAETTPIEVRLIDIEGIHGLIEVLTDVAENATGVVDAFQSYTLEQVDIDELKVALLALNEYVDEHLHDE